MEHGKSLLKCLVVLCGLFCGSAMHAGGVFSEFADPPVACRPMPLWFWNNTRVDSAEVVRQFNCITGKDGYCSL